jgi:hypothetical protein
LLLGSVAADNLGGIGSSLMSHARKGVRRRPRELLIQSDGEVQVNVADSQLFFGPGVLPIAPPVAGTTHGCGAAATAGGGYQVDCTAANGYAGFGVVPGVGGRVPGPIVTHLSISAGGFVEATGTRFPSLEVWRYGVGDADLRFFYDASRHSVDDLHNVGPLSGSGK